MIETSLHVIRHDRAGLLGGVTLRTMRPGERLLGSLSHIHVAEPWVGSGMPTLRLYVGGTTPDTGLYARAFTVSTLDQEEINPGSGLLRVVTQADIDDLVATDSLPINVAVDDGGGNDPESTQGVAMITLSWLVPANDLTTWPL